MYIGKKLETYAKEQPNKIALQGKNEQLSYSELLKQVEKMESYIHRYEKLHNPYIAMLVGNEISFLPLFLAIVRSGCVAIPIDPHWTKHEFIQTIDKINPSLLFASKHFPKKLVQEVEVNAYVEDIFQLKEELYINKKTPTTDDLFYIGFTSGSTGMPKAYARSHYSWLESIHTSKKTFQHHTNQTFFAPGPLCYSLSLFVAIFALEIGASFYMIGNVTPKNIIQAIERVTEPIVYGVPTIFQQLIHTKNKYTFPIGLISSGAKLQSSLRDQLKETFPNSTIYEYYGASELSFITYVDESIYEKNKATIGIPFPGVNISIRDQFHKQLQINEVGFLHVKSPYIFSHYLEESMTEEVQSLYGICIGDLAYKNEEGLLFLLGRDDRMVITGGYNVYPEELENVIRQHNAVYEVAVSSIDDDYWGEIIVAFVQLKDKEKDNLSAVRTFCRSQLASYKQPRKWILLEEFPYTATGKIDYKLLKNIRSNTYE